MADVLGKGVHDGLVQVLDHAVVRAVDVNGHVGHGPGRAAIVRRPLSRAQVSASTMFRERPEDDTAMSTSPGLAWDCSWYTKISW